MAKGDAAEGAFGGVTRQADPVVGQEPGEHLPALEGVVQRLGEIVLAPQPSPGLEHPGVEVGDQWSRNGIAVRQALRGGTPIHLVLGIEHPVDAAHRLGG